MKGTIVFNEAITNESVTNLICQIDSLVNSEHEDIILYFSTEGGEFSSAGILIDYLNRINDDVRLTVIASGFLFSVGFIIFYKLNCDRSILDEAQGLIHLGSMMCETRDLLNSKSIIKKQYDNMKVLNDKMIQEFKILGVSEKDLIEIQEGRDVLYNKEQLEIFLTNLESFNSTAIPIDDDMDDWQ